MASWEITPVAGLGTREFAKRRTVVPDDIKGLDSNSVFVVSGCQHT